jgi:hypothetical protein
MLFTPINYTWSKEFLHSNAINLLDDDNGLITFSIPPKCPTNGQPPCVTDSILGPLAEKEGQANEMVAKKEGQTDVQAEMVMAKNAKATPKKRGLTPLSEKEVRTSERFKNKNNGFKSSSHSDKRCICCSPSPPTMSTKLIKNLGIQFCKKDPANCLIRH